MIQNLVRQSCTGADQSFMGLSKALGDLAKLYGFVGLGKAQQGSAKLYMGLAKLCGACHSFMGLGKATRVLAKLYRGLAKGEGKISKNLTNAPPLYIYISSSP